MSELQDKILDAALPQIVFDGWTQGTLERAAESAGLTAFDARRAFPQGVSECLDYFSQRTDALMLEILKRDYDLPAMKIRERIATAVMVRLRLLLPQREAVRRALASSAMPWHTSGAVKSLYRAVDAMWVAAGDKATDWNFYSKRALLSQVYTSTMSVWLNDHSDNLAETEAFLRRRIENVMQIEKLKAKAREKISKLEEWLPKRRRSV